MSKEKELKEKRKFLFELITAVAKLIAAFAALIVALHS